MPCCNMSINKKYKCDKPGCICIPTEGKSCICVCENERGDIIRCDDCKCFNSDSCQCKCDDSRCTCIVTKGADVVCVCRDARGNIKACDCSCVETRDEKCCKNELTCKSYDCCIQKLEMKTCGCSSKSDEKRITEQARRVERISKNCSNACVFVPTGGNSCVCVCEDESGDIVRCDDCKCTCIDSKGADFICVCRDGTGNIVACDCYCVEAKNKKCDMKALTMERNACCPKKPNRENYCSGSYNRKKDFVEMHRDGGEVRKNCCINTDDSKCCKKEMVLKSNQCCEKKPEKNLGIARRVVRVSTDYKSKCAFVPTDGKYCICVCEDENGDFIRCDDCKCFKSDTCQCKCDDSQCTCIVTNGADIVSVCKDETGNIKVCDYYCTMTRGETCCRKEVSIKPLGCCTKQPNREDCCTFNIDKCREKKPEPKACGGNCKCDEKNTFIRAGRLVSNSNDYKNECVFVPTGGKYCICVCEDENGDIVRCDDCKCYSSDTCQCKCDDSRCTCIITKGADVICVCRDKKGNIVTCDCNCVEANDSKCCQKKTDAKSYGCCTKEMKKRDVCSTCNCRCANDKEEHRPRGSFFNKQELTCTCCDKDTDQAGLVRKPKAIESTENFQSCCVNKQSCGCCYERNAKR